MSPPRDTGNCDGAAIIRLAAENADATPEITVRAGLRHAAADAGIALLKAAGAEIYERGGRLVRVALIKARSLGGEEILVPGIAAVTAPILARALGKAAHWRKFDARARSSPRHRGTPCPCRNAGASDSPILPTINCRI
jgi:hypothetical protein